MGVSPVNKRITPPIIINIAITVTPVGRMVTYQLTFIAFKFYLKKKTIKILDKIVICYLLIRGNELLFILSDLLLVPRLSSRFIKISKRNTFF
jgi:hypothetical protein